MSTGPHKDLKTGKWWFVAELGAGPGARRRQARRRGFATKKAAQEELDRLRTAVREHSYVSRSATTVGAYLDDWLDSLTTRGTALSTIASYRRNISLHVHPALGEVRLQALSASALDSLYAQLLADGRCDGRGGLRPKTVRYIHFILRKALADASRKGLLRRNVADDADPPSAKASTAPEMCWWEPQELNRFLFQVAEEELFPLFRLAAMTGMRRGEVCGIRWSDIDLEGAALVVRRQLLTVDHQMHFADRPKTDKGRRRIELDTETVAVLRRHRTTQSERRLLVGAGWTDLDLVFCGLAGEALHPESVAKVFERRVATSGLPRIRFHDLRHTHCAHLIAAGQDAKVVSTRLGHASVSFTYDRYGHLMPEAGSTAAAAVAALVAGSPA